MTYNEYDLTTRNKGYNDHHSDGYGDSYSDDQSSSKHHDSDDYDDDSGTVDGSHDSSGYEHKKLTLYQACGLNTMNMFGTGPFITIPFVVAATTPPGPQALIGYAIAAFACMNDSLVWSELGSMWPDSGGSYVYLRELFGRHGFGRLAAFLFVWQIMVSGPMECASGFIATAQYISYIDKDYSYMHHSGIAFAMCVATVWSLYREIDEVGTITLVLWAFTIGAITFAIIAGFTTFESKYIQVPDDAFSDGGAFFVSLGIAARFAVYDFTGYYDVNFVGKEVQNASHNIPIACVFTCVIVAMIFFLVDIAVIGSLEWDPDNGGYVELVTSGDDSANFIMALFCETHISRDFAIFFTLIVCITIAGSGFSFMLGLAQIPYTAAKDGYFYAFLAHEHETAKGLSDYALLFVGLLSTIFCFLDLEVVIEGMLTMQLLVQFMGQGFGLLYYRYIVDECEQEEAPFSVPMFPIPNLIQLVIFGFIFCTTDTYIFHGNAPLLEVAIMFLVAGVVMYLLWARKNGFWPYASEELDSDDEGLDHMVVYVAEDGFDDEFNALKKRLRQKDEQILKLKNNFNSHDSRVKDREDDLANTIQSLGKKQYRITQLRRKLDQQAAAEDKLRRQLDCKEREITATKAETQALQEKLNSLILRFGIKDENATENSNRQRPQRVADPNAQKPKPSAPVVDNTDNNNNKNHVLPDDVYQWSIEDVHHWWCNNLPSGAQQHAKMVEECQITGKDLVELDSEMLEQLGIKKLLVMKILKAIEPLSNPGGANTNEQAAQEKDQHAEGGIE